MKKFLKLSRVCVPLSLDCDLSCRYCYRNAGRIPKVPEFNDLMIEYLGQLDPDTTQALVASGGEPLLHFDKVKELFSYAPKRVHKKIMTNGLSLTQEIVDYINENNIETWVSHDGEPTEWLRGVDILKDEEIKALVMQINHLTFSCCCTNKNPDPYENYKYLKSIIPRHFYFHYNAVFADKFCDYLVKDFDYDAYQHGSILCTFEDLDWHNPLKSIKSGTGCNVLPNGDLCGMMEIHHVYGNVLDDLQTIKDNKRKFGDMKPCDNPSCEVYDSCKDGGQYRSYHFCEQRKKTIEMKKAFHARNISC